MIWFFHFFFFLLHICPCCIGSADSDSFFLQERVKLFIQKLHQFPAGAFHAVGMRFKSQSF